MLKRSTTVGWCSHWTWERDELCTQSGKIIAFVMADVLTYGATRLLLEHTQGTLKLRVRATSEHGAYASAQQRGWTVNRMRAVCQSRHYRLDRPYPWSKERVIERADGQLVATVVASLSGRCDIFPGPAFADTPELDAVFLTYCCVLLEAPELRRI